MLIQYLFDLKNPIELSHEWLIIELIDQAQQAKFWSATLIEIWHKNRCQKNILLEREPCGQSYTASTILIYESRVVNISNLWLNLTLDLYIMTVEALKDWPLV